MTMPPPPPHQPPPGGYGHGGPAGPPAGWPGYAPEHPQGTTVLVLGILSLVVCQILGPFAWVMGNRALQEIDAAGGGAANRGQVVAGRICGIIGTVLLIIPLVVLVVMLVSLIGVGVANS